MGSSAFQPITDLATKAKEEWDDVTSGGPIRRMMSSLRGGAKPKDDDEPRPTAKELGWADQPSQASQDSSQSQSAGQRMLKNKAAGQRPKK